MRCIPGQRLTLLRFLCRLSGMSSYTVPAKINLSLRIFGKRDDGYHKVDILMAPIDLTDELDFHNSRTTTLLCSAPGVPLDESNLILKAIREFEKAYGRKAKQRITVTKRIPMQAGLGGGSADAAITLRAVNEILGTQYDEEELHGMAAALGSDVPFFLNPVISRCTGRGEIVTPVPELSTWSSPLVILKPAFGVSTPSAYKLFAGSRKIKGVPYDVQTVNGVELINDLERPVYAKFPYLAHLKLWLLQQSGVRAALLSGSGSSVFALTETLEQAQAIGVAARKELDASLFVYSGMVNPQ